MAGNTSILIKRSTGTSKPTSLASGELAYSYQSNTIFIGTSDGLSTLNIGGYLYTSDIDTATASATANKLVRRDATGNASFNYITANVIGSIAGNANSATQLQTARNFSIDGLDVDSSTVSFDGTGNVVLQGNLKTTGVTSGTYGGETNIPVFTVDNKGRISSASNVSISTTLAITGDAGGTSNVNLSSQTLDIAGGAGLTSTVSGQTITLDVDNTVLRTNTAITLQTIDGSVAISGNLTVSGNVTSIDVQTLNISDPLIYLAGNNYTSDIVDIGFVGNYFDGSTNRHTGVYRHAGNKQFYVFDNYDQEPTNDLIDPTDASFRLATLHANLTANTANVGALHVSNVIYGDTTNNKIILAPSTSYAPGVNDQYIVIDPTAPNHVHVRAGGTIDNSSAELYFGGEENGVQVSDSSKITYIRANTHQWTFGDNGVTTFPNKLLAAQSATTVGGGYSFEGSENNADSGMFSPVDGNVHFYADGTDVAYFTSNKFEITKPVHLTGITKASTSNLVFYNASTGELSYDVDNTLTPTSIANGSYSLSIQSTNGLLVTNGSGLQLANGAIIKDTTDNAVAFGENAGTISQGSQAVAIGDSAGYNSQGAFGVAIGYGAGNVNQGQTAVAIGLNAGMSNQGHYGIAIGNSSGGSQGQYSIAMGYDSGGNQGVGSIAIGNQSGKGNTSAIGVNTITIGNKAGYESAVANSIIFNASGSVLNSVAAGLYINPVRYTDTQDATYDGVMFYNSSTKEVRYSYALDGGSF